MSTRAARRPLPVAMWLCLAQLIVILLLVPGEWMQRVNATEHEWLWRDLSPETAAWVEHKAIGWYNGVIVESGALDATYDHLIPTESQRRRSQGLEQLGQSGWFPLVESRLQATFATVYQVFVRLALITAWLPFFAITAAPAVLDGMMAWKIKQAGFAYASPVVHRLALQTVLWSLVALVSLLIAPLPISPAVLPLFGIVIPIALGQVAAHTQKRV